MSEVFHIHGEKPLQIIDSEGTIWEFDLQKASNRDDGFWVTGEIRPPVRVDLGKTASGDDGTSERPQ